MESARIPAGRRSRSWQWLDDRLGIGGLRYPVPKHANSLAFTLGGITLVSFVLLIVTGVYLAQFYDPTPPGRKPALRSSPTRRLRVP